MFYRYMLDEFEKLILKKNEKCFLRVEGIWGRKGIRKIGGIVRIE